MLELQAQAHAEAGGAFNVDSPKQLQEILFGKLGIPVMRKTPPASRRRRKTCSKSSPQPIPAQVDPGVSRSRQAQIDVHRHAPRADQSGNGANTYLVSPGGCGDRQTLVDRSNLAEYPDPDPGRAAHSAGLRGAPGHSLVAADYSQIELRIMAHLSRDASLLRAFAEDRDVHQATAARCSPRPWAKSVPISGALPRPSISVGDVRDVGIRAPPAAGVGRGDAQNTWIFTSSAIRGSPNADIPYIKRN